MERVKEEDFMAVTLKSKDKEANFSTERKRVKSMCSQ